MKGHFSIEWLSQSSQAACSSKATSSPWISTGTSGTVPESLPGFYGRWRPDSTEPLQRHTEQPAVLSHDHPTSTKQETVPENPTNLQHTSFVPEAGFSSGTEEEETSGYESEGGQSLSPVASKDTTSSTSPSTGRRPRTAFTAEQISSLERAFKRNAYLGTQDKAELCKRLNLSDKQIRNWFQNRRMKLKRTVQDALAHACQAKVASHLMHYPELQTFRPGPYPGYYPAQENPSLYLCPANLHYNPASAGSSISALPVDTLYQYNSLQNLTAAPANSTLVNPYQAFQPYYSSQ
ncbi:ventrally expressed dharma/bozozok antagonist [Chanos chanos]|uniref:Ventrally expressed dharma/bozozok antagonist n=1 Tax=Chanos chanos TaxID=29144 RepID=A0A6J2UYV6_CHACN|nr:homeobox protein vex1-like [Chanos chanos]